MAEKAGLRAALDQLEEEGELEPPAEVVQLGLPGLVDDAAAEDKLVEVDRQRGPGRPEGSKNRNTESWRRWLLAPGRMSPLERLSVVSQANTQALARAWGAKPLEVAKLQVTAAIGLAPYLHQKQPQAIQLDGDGLGLPVMILGAMPEGCRVVESDDGLLIEGEAIEVESEENQ